MHDPDVQLQISELDKVRAQLRLWRTLLSVGFLVVTLGSIAVISKAAHDLFTPGPTQDEFTSTLTANLQKDVVPTLQSKATQALTQMRPEIEDSFQKLNGRVPELSQASMQEISTLQQNVTASSEKTLQSTLGTMLDSKETKIKQMFPDVTDDKIKTALQNVSQESQDRLLHAHDTLFSKHTDALYSIMNHLSQIQATEKVNPQSEKANWEMGVTLLDLMQSQVKDLQPMMTSASTSSTSTTSTTTSRSTTSSTGTVSHAASNVPKPNLSPGAKPTQGAKPAPAAVKPQTKPQANKGAANGTQSSGY